MLFFQFITYSCICQSPFQAYLEDYVSLINAYLDPHNSLEDREEFKYEIMSWHENGPKSVVYNHFRSDGTEYITIENYLENIFVDY